MFILPFSLALMFGSRFIPKFIIILTGFVIGFSFIYPYLLTVNAFNEFIIKQPNFALPIQVIIAVISAAAFWGLFKILGFLGGFLILGFLSKTLFEIIMKNSQSLQASVSNLPISAQTLGWLVFIGFGIIGGIIVLKKTDEAIQFLSMLVGAVLTSFYTLYAIEVVSKMGNLIRILSQSDQSKEMLSLTNQEMVIFLVFIFIYIFLVYYLTNRAMKRRTKVRESNL
jgi:hypothetical protein